MSGEAQAAPEEGRIPEPVRGLSGIYFRVERGGRFLSVCFEDLSVAEQRECLATREDREAWAVNMALALAASLRRVGDQLDIVSEHAAEQEHE